MSSPHGNGDATAERVYVRREGTGATSCAGDQPSRFEMEAEQRRAGHDPGMPDSGGASMTVPPPPPPPLAARPPAPAQAVAGVGLRFVAVLLDGVLLMGLGWMLALAVGQTTSTGFELTGLPAIMWMLAAVAYYIVLEAMVGATVGKLAVGLRVRRVDGGPIDWRASTVRNLLRVVDGFAFYLVGAILVWSSPRRQRLGDRVADTVVARRAS
jgi:uncharacterized RDD family membrane protein YckC